MGPLAHQGHLATVCRQQALLLRGEEWSLVAPSNLPELGGFFHAPTLVRGVPSDQAWREIFGPVATLHRFDSEDEAVRLANQTPFGLAAYVFGEEQRACRMGRRIHAGSIKINGLSLLSLAPTAPRPAWGLSGLGEEGTVEMLRFFTGNRVIGIAGRREAS